MTKALSTRNIPLKFESEAPNILDFLISVLGQKLDFSIYRDPGECSLSHHPPQENIVNIFSHNREEDVNKRALF